MKNSIIIGSRGSKLALWQAYFTQNKLKEQGYNSEIKVITTKGDITHHLSFDKIEGKGFFTKEIEDALLAYEIDLAVHSFKDLPTDNPPGLIIAANSYRADHSDSLIIRDSKFDSSQAFNLIEGATVGTSSARRKAQLLALRPDLTIIDIRGNVPTRVQKLKDHNFDAIVLASAGLDRLKEEIDLEGLKQFKFSPLEMVAAPAQGVLAYQIRENDLGLKELIQCLHDPAVEKAIAIERSILNKLGGGCQQPIGVYSEWDAGTKTNKVWASWASSANSFPTRLFWEGEVNENTAISLANVLLNKSKLSSVFISRELTQNSFFKKSMLDLGVDLQAESLLEFKEIEQSKPFSEAYDWVFFYSKNAFDFFINKNKIKENISIACIGKGTANYISKKGYTPNFIGDAKNFELSAAQFENVASNKTVLYPSSDKSVQHYQKLLKNSNLNQINYSIYSSKIKENIKLKQVDIAVLTSPLNAEAFISQFSKEVVNKIKLIAIGNTTANKINLLGHTCQISYSADEVSLSDLCYI